MSDEQIKIPKKFVYPAIALAIIAVFITGVFITIQPLQQTEQTTKTENTFAPKETTGPQPEKTLELRFAELSTEKTNACSNPNFLGSKTDSDRLQGSCCGPMNFHRYQEQVEGLKKYAFIEKVPPDPYDIPVSLAKELLGYQSIQLSAGQQETYNQAMQMSHEGGPCCCKCWRYNAFEGLAKYLITEYDFSAEQVAEVWNLEDGCGGEGHVGEGHQ